MTKSMDQSPHKTDSCSEGSLPGSLDPHAFHTVSHNIKFNPICGIVQYTDWLLRDSAVH
jgi:hypothetical protein